MKDIELWQGDCLELMKNIPDDSIDMILCDLPYGTTACKWDVIIPFNKMWDSLNNLIGEHTPVLLFGNEPFSSLLRCSNLSFYRYDWIWEKTMATLFQAANKRPMKIYENISVFYKHLPFYNPVLSQGKAYTKKTGDRKISGFHQSDIKYKPNIDKITRFPVDIIKFSNGNRNRLHPTQKPIDLLEYLIKTYTREDDRVLDFTMGSGSTGVACKNLNRRFIGIEKDEKYFNIAKNRILGE